MVVAYGVVSSLICIAVYARMHHNKAHISKLSLPIVWKNIDDGQIVANKRRYNWWHHVELGLGIVVETTNEGQYGSASKIMFVAAVLR